MAKKIVGLIPARGGSKGIPAKNIIPLDGKPLIAYTIEAAKACRNKFPLFVSTDDEHIAEVSIQFGAKVIARPPELASDTSPIIGTIQHALNLLEATGPRPDLVLLLQPTSPLRRSETIDRAIDEFIGHWDDYDSLMPLVQIDGKIGYIRNGAYLPMAKEGSRRQDLEPMYMECGTVFIFKSSVLSKGRMNGDRIYPFIVKSREEATDIDTPEDLAEAEIIVRSRNG